MIKTLVEFSHDTWQERCTIVTAATNEVHEKRVRAETWIRHQELKRDIWKIPSICRDLVRRDKKFFMTAPILQVEMWNIRVDTAIEQGKNSNDINDIRECGRLTNEIMEKVHCTKIYYTEKN